MCNTAPRHSITSAWGTSTIEGYSEFVPEGLKPEAVANLYAGKLSMVGGSLTAPK